MPYKPSTQWDMIVAPGCADIRETINKFYTDDPRGTLQSASKKLGVDYKTLWRKMDDLGIPIKPPFATRVSPVLEKLKAMPEGMTAKEMAARAGCHTTIIYHYIKKGVLTGVVTNNRKRAK